MSASIDGVPFFVDPSSIQWNYTLKMSKTSTVGGLVIQLYGWSMGDLVISGAFGSVERQRAFFAQIDDIADHQNPAATPNGMSPARPVRFSWPEQKWDFWVYVRDLKQSGASVAIEESVSMHNPKYTLTLFVFEDNGTIVKSAGQSAMNAYLRRITAGLGWKQSQWNGPQTAEERQQAVGSQTFFDYAFTQYGLLGDTSTTMSPSERATADNPTLGGTGPQ